MNPDWPPGAKLFYVVATLVLFTAMMWVIGKVIVNPLEDWVRRVAVDWPPELTFGIVGSLILIWPLSIYAMRRQGWL